MWFLIFIHAIWNRYKKINLRLDPFSSPQYLVAAWSPRCHCWWRCPLWPPGWSPYFLLAALSECPGGPEQIKYYEIKPHNTPVPLVTRLLLNFLPGGDLIGMGLFFAVVFLELGPGLGRLGKSASENMWDGELDLAGEKYQMWGKVWLKLKLTYWQSGSGREWEYYSNPPVSCEPYPSNQPASNDLYFLLWKMKNILLWVFPK